MSSQGTSIRMFDYREQYAAIEAEVLEAIRQVLNSGSLILGPRVRAFEENFCRYLGVDGFGVGVGNGTDALAIALRALEIGPGDEVLTVANTAIPTVAAIRMAGATPVFSDIDPRTLLLDPRTAAERITAKTRAIIPVHLYGNMAEMPAICELARRHGLHVIEDCAQSCGSTLGGQASGTLGDIGCFSFYPTKNLGAYGDAGLCFTRDAGLAERMRQIRTYGCADGYDAQREGVNSRLDELQAAILDVKLRHLSAWLAGRQRVAEWYDQQLRPDIVRPSTTPGAKHSHHLYVIQTARRAALIERLQAEGIGFGIHYPKSIHRMRAYDFLGYASGSLPHTERAAEEVLSLPCYPELPPEAVERVAAVVNQVLG
ncbi:MAG TPA: DegT/DnrJ/EryC1/StrS family aminotransferase [Pirellulales bacterium]|jgi:dTDP-4-amino-4,6-dideoxygalactose transaminase|nr:DegT/DnrJ/EryC1/StrS family aminotransferase [Pirellulales bacterium]